MVFAAVFVIAVIALELALRHAAILDAPARPLGFADHVAVVVIAAVLGLAAQAFAAFLLLLLRLA